MPTDCPDYKQIPFIVKVIWSFPRKQHPWILESMERMKNEKSVVHIRDNAALHAFVNSLRVSHADEETNTNCFSPD